MNTNRRRRVPTRFAPETRFEIAPVPAEPTNRSIDTQFERLRARLLLERIRELSDPQFGIRIVRAANEAAALAWITPYPALVFPGLFEEKAEAALTPGESGGRQRADRLDLVVV